MTSKNSSFTEHPVPAKASAKRQWRIRTETGDTFGPADLLTLKAWALDGRLAPTHHLSEDGEKWQAVTAMPELEMDWVAEVTPGSFYGPIHKNALAELIREGAISASAPRFQRDTPDARPPSEHELKLESRLREQQQQLAARTAELEAQRTAARGELEQVRAALNARDLEFDAERQEAKAAQARLQAELLKRDGRIKTLEADAQRIEQLALERQTLEARLSEVEHQAADHARQAAQQRDELAQARHLQHENGRAAALLQERVANHDRETEALRESVRTLRLRLGSARKYLQQATAALGDADETTDAEIVTAPATLTGEPRSGPPPLVTPAGSFKPGMSLVDLEAQAQRELRQLGHKGGSLFKSRGPVHK